MFGIRCIIDIFSNKSLYSLIVFLNAVNDVVIAPCNDNGDVDKFSQIEFKSLVIVWVCFKP